MKIFLSVVGVVGKVPNKRTKDGCTVAGLPNSPAPPDSIQNEKPYFKVVYEVSVGIII